MVDPKERKQKSLDKLAEMHIDYTEYLPAVESSEDVKLKSLDEICYRAIASLISIQLACDINNDEANYEESKDYFEKILKEFNSSDKLLPKEKKLFESTYTEQDVIDIAWTYEAYWSLAWALGFVDNIEDASNICDTNLAISFISKSKDFNDFKNKCKLRNIEEILDMVDLYYRYDWAITDNRLNNTTSIGNLNGEVVVERRRGLEWLISNEKDWFEISLDT